MSNDEKELIFLFGYDDVMDYLLISAYLNMKNCLFDQALSDIDFANKIIDCMKFDDYLSRKDIDDTEERLKYLKMKVLDRMPHDKSEEDK